MRICLEKTTGKLIEMQSNATEGTLIQNAVNAGFAETDIEELEVTEAEWQVILDAQPKLELPPSDRERLEALELAMLDMILGGAE